MISVNEYAEFIEFIGFDYTSSLPSVVDHSAYAEACGLGTVGDETVEAVGVDAGGGGVAALEGGGGLVRGSCRIISRCISFGLLCGSGMRGLASRSISILFCYCRQTILNSSLYCIECIKNY